MNGASANTEPVRRGEHVQTLFWLGGSEGSSERGCQDQLRNEAGT